jgi:protein-S-isoprenylcysteine O-methyltransferase Ste14
LKSLIERDAEHPAGDAGQLILLIVFLAVWVSDSFFLHISTVLAALIPLFLRLAVLVIALVTAVLLAKSGHVVIHQGKQPSTVISAGAFRYVRHPLYLATMLFYLGLTVATASLLALALSGAAVVFYNYIATYEEKLLVVRFGDEYRSYRKKTGQWLPKIGRRS